jgi:sulfite reductase beta subunit-like hemoprotein
MAAQGWCPSTYRIHPADDGGLARLRVPGGVLQPEQIRVIADVARRLGDGRVELTRRANLQLRGLDLDAGPDLRSALAPTGLVGPSAVVEDRRNVVASPTAGLDAEELVDVRPLVVDVVAALDALPEDLDLTHKFGVLLDGGGRLSLGGVPTDVAFGAIEIDGQQLFAVALGAAISDGTDLVVESEDVVALVEVAARRCAGVGRMKELVAEHGRDAVAGDLPVQRLDRVLRRVVDEPPLGAGHGWTGLRPIDAPTMAFDALTTEIRLTPWRSVVIPGAVDVPDGWTTEPFDAVAWAAA